MSTMMNVKKTIYGFTLVEIIVSVAILTMVGLGVVTFQKTVITNSKILQSTLIAQRQIRMTFQMLVNELRGTMPSASGSYPIESVSTSSIVFYSNVDTDPAIERVRYFFSTSTKPNVYDALKKGVTKPTGITYNLATEKITTVVYDVKNSTSTPIFSYYDSSYNGTASSTAPLSLPIPLTLVRFIKITIGVDPNMSRSPVFQYYSTQVSLRNLKDNY